MSEYVIRTLRKDLAKPGTAEWVARVEERLKDEPLRDIDVVAVLDDVRADYGIFEREE